MQDTADPNGPGRWTERQNALRVEKAAQAAVALTVLASLGAMFAWTVMLVDTADPRRSGTFWLLALVGAGWWAPVQSYSRWAMRTLWLSFLAWPALVLAALAALGRSPAGTFGHNAGTVPLYCALAGTTALSLAGLFFLRRSSLPGGTGVAQFRSKDALDTKPVIDGELRNAQLLILMPVIPVTLMGSGGFAALAVSMTAPGAEPALDVAIAASLIGFVAYVVLLIGLVVWGQVQARRQPGRLPAGLIAAAAMLGAAAAGLTVAVLGAGIVRGSGGMVAGAVVMAGVAAAVITSEVVACRRLAARARSYARYPV